jgi:aryl-alcohol dehydrogenase-like predicted oxidoreductase
MHYSVAIVRVPAQDPAPPPPPPGVQNQSSPAFRSSEPELRLCDELGIAFLPWSPLGGISQARKLGSAYAPFARVAKAHGVSPQRVCLAWMLAKSPPVR